MGGVLFPGATNCDMRAHIGTYSTEKQKLKPTAVFALSSALMTAHSGKIEKHSSLISNVYLCFHILLNQADARD